MPMPCPQVMPYSIQCNTPLSNFEAGLDYRDVSDPAVMARGFTLRRPLPNSRKRPPFTRALMGF